MKGTIIQFGNVTLAQGSVSQLVMPWSGGRGWFNVAGSFGGSALVSVSSRTSVEGITMDIPLPTITAPGLYPFEAPFGALSVSMQALGEGDSMTLSQFTVLDLNPMD